MATLIRFVHGADGKGGSYFQTICFGPHFGCGGLGKGVPGVFIGVRDDKTEYQLQLSPAELHTVVSALPSKAQLKKPEIS